jgi:CBS domain containing-hemolysin-like protein
MFQDFLKIFLVLLLVAANAFFVVAEFALVSVRRTRITELVQKGNARAATVQKIIADPDRVIAATQLGITLASLGLGWVGEPALSHLLEPLVVLFPANLQANVSHAISAGLAFAVITLLHVVIGELAPKSVALQFPEKTSLFVAVPMMWAEFIFSPVVKVLNGTGNLFLRLLRVPPATGHEQVHSAEELRMLVADSAAGGRVTRDEGEMLRAIFDFGKLQVSDVMVPRTEIIAIQADTPLAEIPRLMLEHPFTKYPVYGNNLDDIVGILHARDVLTALEEQHHQAEPVRALVRKTFFVPPSMPVTQLLREFRSAHAHITIVLDEFGGTAGLVTLEDLLEEIVGTVSGPFDIESPEIQMLEGKQALINGLTLIEDVNSRLSLTLQSDNYDTIAGYFMERLGSIPKIGDTVSVDSHGQLEVREMDAKRISKILWRPAAKTRAKS